jgi:hypothetical protein
MRKQRGIISLTLIVYALAASAIAGTVIYLIHLGSSHEKAKEEKVTMIAKLDRQIDIGALATELSQTKDALEKERIAHADDLKAMEATYEKNLHSYIPKRALGKSCLTAGFVRYTDSAAAGVPLVPGPLPGPSSTAAPAGDINAPAAIGDDEEGALIARNYMKYHACEQRVSDILKAFDKTRDPFNAKVRDINAKVK